ncbi:type II toxin-antitoxin system HigB family toxin [Rhodoferax ferrireducens]|uniref:type II toxin-antitoxin system HigB family toxin n=1 Tax=Rhodoferax ferrireducens TaxID=192843 RepID=UPI000E0DEC83|nr:type II toxin-antitoxin system HigB family toxin [Rhodoferax ferrireducens]
MRLIGRERLIGLYGTGAQAWLSSWIAEVIAANWKQPLDVRHQFPKAIHKGECNFRFPIDNGAATVDLLIAFPQGIALITDLKVEQ